VRTGRASLALFDQIRIDYYGTPTPLQQAATLAVPEPRLITIQPWDTSIIGEIEKAILKSELGLTPMNDGKIIRISIPRLTEERRKELVKVVRKMAEASKVALRNIRRDANEHLKGLEKKQEDLPGSAPPVDGQGSNLDGQVYREGRWGAGCQRERDSGNLNL